MRASVYLAITAVLLAAASSAFSQTLAVWEYDLTPTIKSKNTLVYRDGSMILHSQYPDGSSASDPVTERPAKLADERRFDLQDSERSEYVTLSASGDVKYFSWEGRQFGTASAQSIHPDFLLIGVNVAVPTCVPKELSEASKQALRLYEELQSFRDAADFARVGFGRGGPYSSWLREAQALHAEAGLETLQQLGFLAGDVMQLGMEYMQVATRGLAPTRYIRDMESTIQAGLALAVCR